MERQRENYAGALPESNRRVENPERMKVNILTSRRGGRGLCIGGRFIANAVRVIEHDRFRIDLVRQRLAGWGTL